MKYEASKVISEPWIIKAEHSLLFTRNYSVTHLQFTTRFGCKSKCWILHELL